MALVAEFFLPPLQRLQLEAVAAKWADFWELPDAGEAAPDE